VQVKGPSRPGAYRRVRRILALAVLHVQSVARHPAWRPCRGQRRFGISLPFGSCRAAEDRPTRFARGCRTARARSPGSRRSSCPQLRCDDRDAHRREPASRHTHARAKRSDRTTDRCPRSAGRSAPQATSPLSRNPTGPSRRRVACEAPYRTRLREHRRRPIALIALQAVRDDRTTSSPALHTQKRSHPVQFGAQGRLEGRAVGRN